MGEIIYYLFCLYYLFPQTLLYLPVVSVLAVFHADSYLRQTVADFVGQRPVFRRFRLHAHVEQHLDQRSEHVAARSLRLLLVAQTEYVEYPAFHRRTQCVEVFRRDCLLPLGERVEYSHPVEQSRNHHRRVEVVRHRGFAAVGEVCRIDGRFRRRLHLAQSLDTLHQTVQSLLRRLQRLVREVERRAVG